MKLTTSYLELLKTTLTEKYYLRITKFLIIISPIIPHFASECLEDIGVKGNLKWPSVDKSKLKSETLIL